MSDTQNTNPETQTPVTQTEELSTTPVVSPSDRPTRPQGDRPRNGGDRRGGRNGAREEDKEFKEELLAIDRVTRVTAGGRQIRFRASIVIGDGK